MTVVTCPGILLRSYEYSDSSRIFRFLTPGHGLVSLVGKGVRRKSALGEAPIQTFSEGSLTFYHRPGRDLHTLREFQSQPADLALAKEMRRFVGASVIAEILLVHGLEGADVDLYEWVRHAFGQLGSVSSDEVTGWVLSGAWKALAHLGYPPEVGRCVRCGADLEEPVDERAGGEAIGRFDASAGGLLCPACSVDRSLPRVGPGARRDLESLVAGSPPVSLRAETAHLSLLEAFALHHLAPRSGFRSFATLRPLLNKMAAAGYS